MSDFYNVAKKYGQCARQGKGCDHQRLHHAKLGDGSGVVRWGELNGAAACCNGASYVRVKDGFVLDRHCLPQDSIEAW
ncbi:MAG: hypothetical protein ACLT0Y_01125 [Christensenellales bacterium]